MDSSAEQDLAMIRRIMEESRGAVMDRGKHFVIWGTLPVLGLLATYLFAIGRIALHPTWAWMGVLVVGWAVSLIIGFRDGRGARVTTLGRRMLAGVWVAMAVTLTLIALGGMFGPVVSASALPGLVAAVIAAPVLLTRMLTGERWLGWVAAGWWVGAAVMLFRPGVYTLLLMAAMSLTLMAVPGVVLYVRSRHPTGAVGVNAR